MPIRTQLLKKWVKNTGSTPLHLTNLPIGQVTDREVNSLNEWQTSAVKNVAVWLRCRHAEFNVSDFISRQVDSLVIWVLAIWPAAVVCMRRMCRCHSMYVCIFDAVDEYCHCIELWCGYASVLTVLLHNAVVDNLHRSVISLYICLPLHRYSDMMYLVLRNIRDNDYGTTVILFLRCFNSVGCVAERASDL